MRLAFLLALFAGAIFYSWIAYLDLNFLTRTGRLGPGFFPRILSIGLLVLIGWSLVEELVARRRTQGGPEPEEQGLGGAVITIIALGAGYLAAIVILGGVVGSMLFLAAALSVFNAGDHVRNAAVAIGIPMLIYLIFSVLLNSGIPEGLVPMPL